jgi:predicted amidohydrolase YtcJ
VGPAEAVILGRILTLAGEQGLGEVAAIAIRDGRVLAAGSRPEVELLVGPRTRRIALGPDEVALPGLTDSHLHLAAASIALDQIELTDDATLEDGLRRIARAHAVADPGAWLAGHGWMRDRWGGWPTAT